MTKYKDPNRQVLVKQLTALVNGKGAHATFEQVVGGLPAELRGKKPDQLPYSIWQLVEHIRISQWDILEFSKSANHKSPSWPDEYWPDEEAPADDKAWEQSLEQIQKDRQELINLLENADNDLYEPFSYGDGQTLLREALLTADHTSYHTGEIIVIRRLLGAWKK